jgi:hypothetical protein
MLMSSSGLQVPLGFAADKSGDRLLQDWLGPGRTNVYRLGGNCSQGVGWGG